MFVFAHIHIYIGAYVHTYADIFFFNLFVFNQCVYIYMYTMGLFELCPIISDRAVGQRAPMGSAKVCYEHGGVVTNLALLVDGKKPIGYVALPKW